MDANEARALFAHDRELNLAILDAAARVSEADWLADVPGLSYGSGHGAMAHLLGTEVVWLARWQGKNPTSILGPADFPALEALRTRWLAHDANLGAYLDALTDAEVTRVVHYSNTTCTQFTDTISEQMLHVALHSSQFRGEVAVRLTALGQSPGNLDFIARKRRIAGG